MEQLPDNVKAEILRMVRDLVHQPYHALADDGRAGRLSETELRNAIDDYGHTLVEPPTDVWQVVDVYPHDGKRGEWAVDFPLWTEKEGRSDLTLAISVRESDGRGAVAVGDLHVL